MNILLCKNFLFFFCWGKKPSTQHPVATYEHCGWACVIFFGSMLQLAFGVMLCADCVVVWVIGQVFLWIE